MGADGAQSRSHSAAPNAPHPTHTWLPPSHPAPIAPTAPIRIHPPIHTYPHLHLPHLSAPSTPVVHSPHVPSHIVIVGGARGSMQRSVARRCRVTLVDRQNHHVFQPLLYGGHGRPAPGDIASPSAATPAQPARPARQRGRTGSAGQAAASRRRRRRSMRRADPGDRRHPTPTSATRLAGTGAGAEDPGRCARNQAAGVAGLRARRARGPSRAPAPAADLRHRRRRADRRRTGRGARRDRATGAGVGVRCRRSRDGAHPARRGRAVDPAVVSRIAAVRRRAAR